MPPQTEGFHVLKTIGSFLADGNHSEKIATSKEQTSTREEKIKTLMGRIGIAVDTVKALHKSTENWTEGWKTMWSKEGWSGLWRKITGAQEFQHGIATAVATGAGMMAEGASGGTLGAIGAFVMEAGELVNKHWGQPPDDVTKGDWVAIDNGVVRLKRKMKAALSWGMGAIFEDFPEEEELEMDTERLVSFGFVVDITDASDVVKVFNFETGEQQDIRKNMVRRLPELRQREITDNENMMAIQSIIMDKDEVAHKLACDVPCDPGEEVTYKGQLYNIVTCDGTIARIEDALESFDVHMKELGRGRVDHINSWNYRTEIGEDGEPPEQSTIYPESVKSGFNSSSRSAIYKGSWVWVNPRSKILKVYPLCKKELGVVMVINGALAVGYYTIDGVRFDTHLSQIVTVHEERQEWLNQHKSFFKFKSYATTGDYLVKSFALGRDFHLICLGLAKLSGILTDEGHTFEVTPDAGNTEALVYGDPSGKITRDGLDKPDLSRKEMTDAYQNLARGSNLSQNKAYQAVMRGGFAAGPSSIPGGNTTLIVAGVAVVAIGLYFYAR